MATRHNNFAFQEAFNRRIILWNEPNYEPSNTDLIKMICAGDAYNVNVKHKDQAAIHPSPVIMLTNNYIPLMGDPTFRERIQIYKWRTAPFLKNYDKKPNPLCIFELFVHYNVIEDNVIIVEELE